MFYVIHDTLLKVSLNTNKTGHHVLPFNNVSGITWWPVLLVFNDTFNNVSGIAYNMVTSFIGVYRPDTLLKVVLNTNKTGHSVLRYTWHIVESVVCVRYNVEHGDQFYWCLTTFNNVSGIVYNMVTSFIGV
jgi:hypothetical protein